MEVIGGTLSEVVMAVAAVVAGVETAVAGVETEGEMEVVAVMVEIEKQHQPRSPLPGKNIFIEKV